MITYDENIDLNFQIQNDIKKLEQYKSSYVKKIDLYSKFLNSGMLHQDMEIVTNINDNLKAIKMQISKIEKAIDTLNEFSDSINIPKNEVFKYNKKFDGISQNFIKNFIIEKEIVKDFMSLNNIEENDTLIISENLNKVVFPYTVTEILKVMKDNNFKTVEEAVDAEFTKPLSYFRIQFMSRYRETLKLAIDREGYNLLDAITLATEMMGKRYLHPAIIAACKSLDELDVYLDCLDKGELEDFKVFKVKYELYPMVIKPNSLISKFKKLFKSKNEDLNEVDINTKE